MKTNKKKILGIAFIVLSSMILISGVAILWGTPATKAILITVGFSALVGAIAGGIYLCEKGEKEDET